MYRIELLTGEHNAESFDCGDEKKNEFLVKFALQNTKGGLGRTYVAVKPPDKTTVFGYYTISSSSINFKQPLNTYLPRYPLPAILIGKLATAEQAQGQGLGTALLLDALKRSARVAEEIGVFLVEIRAIDERARSLYIKLGFTAMQDDPMKLFFNLKKVQKLLTA